MTGRGLEAILRIEVAGRVVENGRSVLNEREARREAMCR